MRLLSLNTIYVLTRNGVAREMVRVDRNASLQNNNNMVWHDVTKRHMPTNVWTDASEAAGRCQIDAVQGMISFASMPAVVFYLYRKPGKGEVVPPPPQHRMV